MKINNLIIALVLIILTSCGSNNTSNIIEVKSFGNRQKILQNGNLDAVVKIDSLFDKEALYAIGPVEGLKGEITVYNNLVAIASIKDNEPIISKSKNTKAIFLIMSNENDWVEYTIKKELKGLDAVEDYVKDMLVLNDINGSTAIPFRIESNVKTLEYHIIFKKDSTEHNKKEHQKAKVKFNTNHTDINIIGFWVNTQRMGKFTHPGKRTHLHFISKDHTISGHIDHVIIPKGSKIYLPIT